MDLISKIQYPWKQSRLNSFYQPKKIAKGNLDFFIFQKKIPKKKFPKKILKKIFRTSSDEKEKMCNLCQTEKPLFCYNCSINLSTLPVSAPKTGPTAVRMLVT